MAMLTPSPKMQFFDANGDPLVGGKLYTYAAGTNTPLATYTDAGGATPNSNPVILDSRGEANVWLGVTQYKFTLKDSLDTLIWTVDNLNQADAVTLGLLAASSGSSLVGFIQGGTGAVARTAQNKMRDLVNVKDFGAVGDGVTDDTTAIQNAATRCAALGGGIVFVPAGTYKVSSPITVASYVSIYGEGMGVTKFSATAAFTASQAVFYANGSSYTRYEGFSILGNTDGTNGAGTGIHCKTGTGNQIHAVFISNTTQAGIRLQEQNNAWVDSCWLQSNGRTGYTDNHGIMVYSEAGSTVPNYAIKITNNKVNNAFRKGITDYAPNADIYDLVVEGNTVESCGLGGIYLGTPNERDVRVVNNYVASCYVNIQVGPVTNCVIDGNNVRDASGDFGIGFYSSKNLILSNNTIIGSAISGIDTIIVALTRNSQVLISGNVVHNSNRTSAAFGPGIYVDECDNPIVTGNIVYDDAGSIRITQGIVDGTGNVNCQIAANTVINSTSSNYLIQSTTAMLQELTFGQTFNFQSGIKVQQNNLTLVAGANNNVALPARSGIVRITGPGAVYSLTGMTSGAVGRQVTLVNDTAFAMTLKINDVGSTAGNRFLLTGGVDKVVPAYGSVPLNYVTVQGNNFWVDV